jgi:hypothetical protein
MVMVGGALSGARVRSRGLMPASQINSTAASLMDRISAWSCAPVREHLR